MSRDTLATTLGGLSILLTLVGAVGLFLVPVGSPTFVSLVLLVAVGLITGLLAPGSRHEPQD